MIEKEMGYRGSKSITDLHKPTSHKSVIVKEQRVDGSWCGISLPHLRCTLMGFERNYQIRIPSNQKNNLIRLYSSKVILEKESNNVDLSWFFCGLLVLLEAIKIKLVEV